MRTQVLKEKMDVLRLTFYTAPVSVGILVPFFLMTEFKKLMSYGCEATWNADKPFMRVKAQRKISTLLLIAA